MRHNYLTLRISVYDSAWLNDTMGGMGILSGVNRDLAGMAGTTRLFFSKELFLGWLDKAMPLANSDPRDVARPGSEG